MTGDTSRKLLVERLILGLTCRKYNLEYEGVWNFHLQEKDGKFQLFAVTSHWTYELTPVWKEIITKRVLVSPVGDPEQLHFWLSGVLSTLDWTYHHSQLIPPAIG